jgi:uncharacterized protein (DUF1697 family)
MKHTVHIILFRGVGGATQLPTKPLRERLAAAGFENVATYINSGNAIVRSDMNRKEVISRIALLCREHFSFEKVIFAPTLDEWEKLVMRNPFRAAAKESPTTVHAALLEQAPDPASIKRVRASAIAGEEFKVIGQVAYLYTPHGFGRSKMAGNFDQWIGVPNTARNWRTVLKLAELGRAAAT